MTLTHTSTSNYSVTYSSITYCCFDVQCSSCLTSEVMEILFGFSYVTESSFEDSGKLHLWNEVFSYGAAVRKLVQHQLSFDCVKAAGINVAIERVNKFKPTAIFLRQNVPDSSLPPSFSINLINHATFFLFALFCETCREFA